MEEANSMKRKSLRDDIVRLYEAGKTVTHIATELGCTKANVSLTIKRALSWNQTISPPLPPRIISWIMDEATRQDKAPAVVARELLIKAFDDKKLD
jgi:hypothetical protein